MSTFVDLYRARAGKASQQDENFLVAATGFLINTVPSAARVILEAFGAPGAVRVWCSGQEGLFDVGSGRSVGRTDLSLRWIQDGKRRLLVVEAKLDSPVEREQLERYSRALGADARVVLLARSIPPALPTGVDGYTWSLIASRLLPLADESTAGGALIRQWLDFAQDRGVVCAARIHLDAGSAGMAAAESLEGVDAMLKELLPYAVPSPYRQCLPALLKDGGGDYDVGWYGEWERSESRARGNLAFHGIGISARADPLGGLSWTCEIIPRTKAIGDALIAAGDLPWRKSGVGEWLRADVAHSGPTSKFPDACGEAIRNCRAALRAPDGLDDAAGLWKGAATGLVPVVDDVRTVADLAAEIAAARMVRDADEVLTRRWIREIRNRVVNSGVACRAVYHQGSSFYAKDGSFQVGAWIELGSVERPLVVWIWWQDRARADRLIERKVDGWTIWREDRPNSVYAAPTPPRILDAELMDDLAARTVPVLLA